MATWNIDTALKLSKIGAGDPNYPYMLDDDYIQTADIDLSDLGTAWLPIAGKTSSFRNFFAGSYNGNGFTISNLVVYGADIDYKCIGLFGGITTSAVLRNIKIVSGAIEGNTISTYVGAVCGYNYDGQITGCSNAANIAAPVSERVGGICGYSYAPGGESHSALIAACKNTGAIRGGQYTGGVCGYNRCTNENISAEITACYNTGDISGNGEVGGVCGYNESENSTVTACYNTGAVRVASGGYLGGVCGWTKLNTTITGCYWVSGTGPAYGIGYADDLGTGTNTGAEIFSATNWPVVTDPEWGIGSGGDNAYWKTLGSPPSNYPALWWE